jgi:hypothetical protein
LTAKIAALLLLLVTVAGPAVAAFAQPNAIPNIPDNPYGANVFLNKEAEPWKVEQTLKMASEANIPWIKQEFPWQEIEFKKGYFHDDKWNISSWDKFDRIMDLADKYHVKIIARVSHPPAWAQATDGSGPLKDNKDLADFTNALLDHYKGRLQYVQIWNEPNLSAEWVPGKPVDPKGYVEMMKTVYPAVKAAHPDAVILSAPLAITLESVASRGNMDDLDYWTALYANGIKGYFDIASANAYGLDQPPDAAPGPKILNFRRVELLRDIMVQNGDTDKAIWLNEYGWNASPDTLSEEQKNYWRHVSEQTQADWTVQGVQYARQHWPWAGVISIWYFRQVGDVPPDQAEYYFRMVNPDFTPVLVYDAVKNDAMKYPGPASQPAGTPVFAPPTTTAVPPYHNATATPVPPAPTPPPAGPTNTPAQAASATSAPAVVTVTATVAVTSTVAGTSVPAQSPTAGAVATATTTPTQVAGSSSNTLLFVLGGALVLAGLVGVGYWFMRGRGTAS